MCWRKKNLKSDQEEYKKKIQEFNQSKWKDDPIEIEELIFADYEENVAEGAVPKNQIVFIDTAFDLDWITSYSLDEHALHLVNDIMVLTSLPYKHFSKDKQLAFLRILGQGIVAAFSGNDDDVRKCREQASNFHRLNSLDLYKEFRLKVSTIIFTIVFVLFNILHHIANVENLIFTAGYWGFIGAYVSICLKNGTNDTSYSYNKSFVFWDLVSRFIIGSIFGVLIYYFTNSFLFKMDSGIRTKDNFVILAFIAGFSEKLIPNLLGKYENKFVKGE